jgi:hypothetical protein
MVQVQCRPCTGQANGVAVFCVCVSFNRQSTSGGTKTTRQPSHCSCLVAQVGLVCVCTAMSCGCRECDYVIMRTQCDNLDMIHSWILGIFNFKEMQAQAT